MIMKKIMLSIIALVSSISMVQAQTYKIGDVYDKGGVKGVVFYVDDSGEHGLLVSPSGFKGNKWCTKGQANNTINCYDEKDGAVNMETIATYIKDNDASWDEFPLFQWARSLGEGWYIPASDELKLLAKAINDGEEYSEKNDIINASDVEEQVVSQETINEFTATLDDTDKRILELRMEGRTYEEIAKEVGFKTPSAVHKQKKKIGAAYQKHTETNIGYD